MALALALRSDVLFQRDFTLRKFYVLMGWAPLTFVVLAAAIDVRYLLFFVVAGIAGIVGELLVSVLWLHFFDRPIWTYSHRSVLKGYTSTLNFLPWAVGALLFVVSGRLVVGEGGDIVRPFMVSAAGVAGGLFLSLLGNRLLKNRNRRFTKPAFAVFCLPIATTAIALSFACGPEYLLLMTLFAFVGFLTEYGYGRGMTLFFDRGLWTYNHWQIDAGHTSFVTPPLWALGGLYFYLIATALGL